MLCTYEQVEQRILELLQKQGRIVLAIDGRCASGKTTLANQLQKKLGGTIIHLDDFFLRPEQRTPERYAEPGGNVDYERFEKEVLIPLKEERDFIYYPFDCRTMTIQSEPVFVENGQLILIEGSYSLLTVFRPYYDRTLFLTISQEMQLERLRKRAPEKVEMFQKKWIPLEEYYIQQMRIEEVADDVMFWKNAMCNCI